MAQATLDLGGESYWRQVPAPWRHIVLSVRASCLAEGVGVNGNQKTSHSAGCEYTLRYMRSMLSRVTCRVMTSATERGTLIAGSGRHDPSGSTDRFAVELGMLRHTPS